MKCCPPATRPVCASYPRRCSMSPTRCLQNRPLQNPSFARARYSISLSGEPKSTERRASLGILRLPALANQLGCPRRTLPTARLGTRVSRNTRNVDNVRAHAVHPAVALPQAVVTRTTRRHESELDVFSKCQDEPTYWSRWEKWRLLRWVRLTRGGA